MVCDIQGLFFILFVSFVFVCKQDQWQAYSSLRGLMYVVFLGMIAGESDLLLSGQA